MEGTVKGKILDHPLSGVKERNNLFQLRFLFISWVEE